MSWSRNFTISEILKTPEVGGGNPTEATWTTGAMFQINNVKLYAPVVTFPINDNIKFFEYLKQGFRRTKSWKKYRSEIRTESKSNNSDSMIDPTFRYINRLFVLSFKNCDDDPTRNSFDKYYMSLTEIKDFNALIDNKPFSDPSVNNKQQVWETMTMQQKTC